MDEIGIKRFSQLANIKKGDVISQGEQFTLVKLDTILIDYNLKYILKYKSVYENMFEITQEF